MVVPASVFTEKSFISTNASDEPNIKRRRRKMNKQNSTDAFCPDNGPTETAYSRPYSLRQRECIQRPVRFSDF